MTEVLHDWRERQAAHRERVQRLTEGHRRRRAEGERHPVWDFMFSYYPTTPGKLSHWHPGVNKAVVWDGGDDLPQYKDHYVRQGDVWILDVERYMAARGKTVRYIARLLDATYRHPPVLGCFGLHEWAMVYKDTPRHPEPLRLGARGTDEVVEKSQLKCTHFDAYRFFTDAAAPHNAHTPTRDSQPQLEQPGCLHATMDLYKWATKLGPLVPGELWLDCFELACDVRRLDMEASPYDLREWGFDPVRIETPAGRAEYVQRQKGLMGRGQEIRKQLLAYTG